MIELTEHGFSGNMSISQSVWVVIPAFNEGYTLGSVLTDLIALNYNVVVVDDGSSDSTGEVALQAGATLLTHVTNLGQGAALQTGICYALTRPGVNWIVTFDADGQHQASDIGMMLELLQNGNYDVVLGSRFLTGGAARNIHPVRSLALRFAVWLTRQATHLPLTDTHNGLRVFTASAAAKLNITQNGMAHASEILALIATHRLRVCEAPVTITYTAYSLRKGQSLLNSINILWEIMAEKLR